MEAVNLVDGYWLLARLSWLLFGLGRVESSPASCAAVPSVRTGTTAVGASCRDMPLRDVTVPMSIVSRRDLAL